MEKDLKIDAQFHSGGIRSKMEYDQKLNNI